MPFFRKGRFAIIEAFQLSEDGVTPDWLSGVAVERTDEGLLLPSDEGVKLASWGCWIVRNHAGQIYSIEDDAFQKVYAGMEVVEGDGEHRI